MNHAPAAISAADDRPCLPATPGLAPARAIDVLEGLGEALVVLDRDWTVTAWNAAAERLSGVSRRDVLGLTVWKCFPGLVGTPLERVLRDAMERRRTRELRGWRYPRTGDAAHPELFDARTYPLDDGSLLLLFTDATAREAQRRELDARIRENESLRDFARKMAEVADTGALLHLLCEAALTELDGIASLVVRAMGDGFGRALAAAGAASPLEGELLPLGGSLIERVIQGGGALNMACYASESPHFRAVARATDLGPMVLVPLVAHGERLGVLAVARRSGATPFSEDDVRRLRVFVDHASLAAWKALLLERAEEANETKANFLATMSHELRTPLTALTGYGELLADEILGPLGRQQHDVVERMRAVTHHLSAMIDELLTYSSLEAGREHARLRVVPLGEVVEEALAVAEPLAQQKDIDFVADPYAALPHACTDADKVRQILVNLLSNAVKFTDRGQVRLSYDVDDESVRFHVRDTGVGISVADQARLFHPFVQLDTGLTRRHGGTGLGLYISRRLADLLGGRIELESEPGVGSHFTLVLKR